MNSAPLKTFHQQLQTSFGMLIALLAINFLIAIATVLSVIHDMDTQSEIDLITNNIHRIRASESSFMATKSRDHSKEVFDLLESTRKRLTSLAGDSNSHADNLTGIISLLDEFRVIFLKFVAENDQNGALESRILDNGRKLARRLGTARSSDTMSVGGDDMASIIGQILDLQWQRKDTAPESRKALAGRINDISKQLAVREERVRSGRQDIAGRMLLFGVIRDVREYVSNLEQYLKSQSDIHQTENELFAISARIQESVEKVAGEIRGDIRQRAIISSSLMLLLFAVSFICSMFLGRHLARKITLPISELVAVTKEIAAGNPEARATVGQFDEIAELSACFNQMTDSLQRSEQELKEYNATLEERVRERTEDLTATIAELKQTQRLLVQAGKMVALGETIAGIAHEINTPLGVVKSSIEHMNTVIPRTIPLLPDFLSSLAPDARNDFLELFRRVSTYRKNLSTREEREKKKALVPVLAVLRSQGALPEPQRTAEMLTGIGIETVDPLVERIVLHPQGETILRTIVGLSTVLQHSHTIETAVQRASKVVFALKTYGRLDSAPVMESINIIDDIEIALTLYHNLMRHSVEVVREYQPLPEIAGYRDELTQIWMNLIHNALQAMNFKGRLTIRAVEQDGLVVLSFNDTGTGINDQIRDQIFDPFFTTKPTGEGSGLGLDIVLRIVERHKGAISFESRPGDTTFTVSLPVNAIQGTA